MRFGTTKPKEKQHRTDAAVTQVQDAPTLTSTTPDTAGMVSAAAAAHSPISPSAGVVLVEMEQVPQLIDVVLATMEQRWGKPQGCPLDAPESGGNAPTVSPPVNGTVRGGLGKRGDDEAQKERRRQHMNRSRGQRHRQQVAELKQQISALEVELKRLARRAGEPVPKVGTASPAAPRVRLNGTHVTH